MIVDHSYNRLLHLDWIQADVDGDGLWEYLRHADQTGPGPPVVPRGQLRAFYASPLTACSMALDAASRSWPRDRIKPSWSITT